LAAAERAKDAGAARVFVIDRDRELGGILQQCIHNGFGLQLFKEDLTGPEYAHRFIDSACLKGVEVLLNSMVLEVTPSRTLYVISRDQGMLEITAKAVVLAMGCRERNRGAVTIPGTRPPEYLLQEPHSALLIWKVLFRENACCSGSGMWG